jgi:hypothetical protein
VNKLVEPKLSVVELDKIILRRLKDYPDYHKEFIGAVTNSIKNDYDEITDDFAKNLIAVDKKGYDEFGYFTLGKDIWLIFDKNTNEFLGFEVITRKRGGSIKLGPTYLKPEARGGGYAVQMIEGLCRIYASKGARKVYVTAPLGHKSTAILDFNHLNLKLEAILHNHYSKGSSERICGKFINDNSSVNTMVPRVKSGNKKIINIYEDGLRYVEYDEFSEFIIENMKPNYNDIDHTFVESIFNGVKMGIETKYEKKGKVAFTFFSNDAFEGIAVAALKRGGVFKVAPFLLTDECITMVNVTNIIKKIEEYAMKYKRRKITILLPVRDLNIANILSQNYFISEGVLREPYKDGVDIVVFSKELSI